MKNLLLIIAIISSGLINAQTSINDFIGTWNFTQGGIPLKITPLSNNEGGTKAQY